MKTLMLMLQVCPLDVYKGQELLRLICEIESEKRSDVEFGIAWRRDTNAFAVRELATIAKTKFAVVHALPGKRRSTGHPLGCNDLWQESMDNVLRMTKSGSTKASGVLTFEADCIPLRPDWINVLKSEWIGAFMAGKLVMGHAHSKPSDAPPTHINGNAVFAADILLKYPQLGDSNGRNGWDTHNGKLLLNIGQDTFAIYQKYRMQAISRDEVESFRKFDRIPALFHGLKTPDGIKHIRSMMADGSFSKRVKSS